VLLEEIVPIANHIFSFVDKLDKYGNTALIEAVKHKHYECAQLLIEKGNANVNFQNRMMNTAAHVAAMNGHFEMTKLLVKSGSNVLLKNNEKFTCFDHAENAGQTEVLEFLEPVIMEAKIWREKNCLAKIFVNK